MYTLLEGASPNRRLTIEWYNIPYNPNVGNATFEITLYESSNQILVQYKDTIFGNGADNGATAIAGVENKTGISGQAYSCSAPNLTNLTAWRAIPVSQYRLFIDSMEGGVNGWSTSGTPVVLWHQEAASCSPNYRSPSTSWYYGQASTCTYNTGATNSGTLTSPSISADYYTNLNNWHRRQTQGGSVKDLSYIQVSENGGPMVNQVQITVSDNAWRHRTTDISSHSGKNIQIGFFFDTVDALNNNNLGWMIDDVEVWGCNVYGTSPIKALAYAKPTPVCETSSYLLDGTGTYATGCTNLNYQWYENGSIILGATTITYTVPANHAPGTFAYTLTATCADNPSQTDTSDPVSVQVVGLPSAVSNSLLLSKISAGTQIHFTWANSTGSDGYIAFSDTNPAGTFTTQVGTSTSGIIGLDILMPTNSRFYLVAGQNAVCGPGPKK